jgi:hypothetical protein
MESWGRSAWICSSPRGEKTEDLGQLSSENRHLVGRHMMPSAFETRIVPTCMFEYEFGVWSHVPQGLLKTR